MDSITAQKFAEVYGIEKIKQIITNCPQNCDVYRECVGDTIIRQIPIGVFQTVLVTLGHEPNPPIKEITND
ncbi:hypothetical protein [Moraxella sp. VT-16-12]|uniref:hypothetical protein n=1 Tax=Moraxella sp. VT-16-12 TaxID=2014877 RepID=UPI000B7DDC8B|nr:hypothetical protein [Moraxella sp. VT-16-12]TWV81543.1 hypothetical protein CEW93_007455 [Moraxella sp. VT-16-12]